VKPKLKMHGKWKCKLASEADSPYVVDVGGDIITVHLDPVDLPPPHVGF